MILYPPLGKKKKTNTGVQRKKEKIILLAQKGWHRAKAAAFG